MFYKDDEKPLKVKAVEAVLILVDALLWFNVIIQYMGGMFG